MSTLTEVGPLQERSTVSNPCTLRPDAVSVIGAGVGVGVGVDAAVAVGVGLGGTVAVGVAMGVAVGVGPPCTKLTKTSCCELPLMIVRPSVQPPMAVVPKELW